MIGFTPDDLVDLRRWAVCAAVVVLTHGGIAAAMDHTAIVYLMDKSGRFVSPFSLKRTTDTAAADLRRYL